MNKKIENSNSFIGQSFGRLTILSIIKKRATCRCECGNIKDYSLYNLLYGSTKSCGCLNVECRIKHGLSGSLIYGIWRGMKQRCYDPKDKGYNNYGGRGITVCDEWLNDSSAFIKWALANGYQKGLEIDRRENDGIYSPDNCRFVTTLINNRNRRSTRLHLYNGEKRVLKEWAEILNLDYQLVAFRIYSGWDFEKAIKTPRKLIKNRHEQP